MARYGYEIVNVLITDLSPDKSVTRAMNEINAARRMREAALDKVNPTDQIERNLTEHMSPYTDDSTQGCYIDPLMQHA